MNDTILLETFLLKTCSLDGYTILIGGICPKGKKKEAADTYSQINNIKLGFLKDEYLIDVILADLLRKLSPNWIIVLGASIFIEGVINSTGGIIGNPFEGNQSSNGEIGKIISGLYMVAMAGGPGIAYKGTYEDGVRIRDNIIKDKKDNCLMIHDIIEQLDSFTNLYIVVLDGSGAISCGEIFVSDSSEKDYEVIRF
jgi:hypothetical protein